MNKIFNFLLDANAIHDAILEHFPLVAGILHVDSTPAFIHFYMDEPAPAGLAEMLDKIPVLVLSPNKQRIVADGADVAVITVKKNAASVTLKVYDSDDKVNAIDVTVTLTNGTGSLSVTSLTRGLKIVELIDATHFARVRLEAF